MHWLKESSVDFLFNLERTDKRGLQNQLRNKICEAILNGSIPPRTIMPSSRKLANKLGVARNTVMLTYAALQDNGYLVSEERKGYYVNPSIFEEPLYIKKLEQPAKIEVTSSVDWEKKATYNSKRERQCVKPGDWRNFKYSFGYGQIDPATFPVREWRECWRDAVGVQEISDWSQDLNDRDDHMLLEQIRTRLLTRRGLWVDEKQILVTVGAQNALYIAMQLLLTKSRTLGIEEPGYADARNIGKIFTSNIQSLAIDDEGLCISEDLRNCDVAYVTPSHQSPTTVTMSGERRKELVSFCEENDVILLEDDYESETNFSSKPLPALMSYDNFGRVIYIGSLSKTLAPGLRIGYMVGPEPLIEAARSLRRLIMRHPAANNQRAAAYFLERGYHERLLRELVSTNKSKWEIILAKLKNDLPQIKISQNLGGSSFWITCPESIDTQRLAQECKKEGVIIEPGDVHFHGENRPYNYFRIGFSSIPLNRIEPGLDILARNIENLDQSLL